MRIRHPLIKRAQELPHCVVLCCHEARPGLLEKHVEAAGVQILEAAGWYVIRVAAEGGMAQRNKRATRGASKGDLDLVAYEPTGFLQSYRPSPWLIEVKGGNKDLRPEQLETIEKAQTWGLRCLVYDESSLLAAWIKER